MKVIITGDSYFIRVVLVENNQIEYFFVDKIPSDIFVGNIYKGKIEKIHKGLNASFINIGKRENGFLHFGDKEVYFGEENFRQLLPETKTHKEGENIIVQVTKPGKELKGMKLTTRITLPGKYLVFIPDSKIKAISKKIKDKKERNRLMTLVKKYIPSNDGFIIRTYAENKDARYIVNEAKYLYNEWKRMKKLDKKFHAPYLLWQELPLHTRIIRDFVNEKTEEIIVEGEKFYNDIKVYIKKWCPEFIRKLKFYNYDIPLFEKFDLNKKILNFLNEKVYLPSGGYLLIEEGSTLTAIDVNTGSFESKSYSETIYNTDIEAAMEIPRQIRVRNLSGLIIIDFIDIKGQEKKKKIFENFQKFLGDEKVKLLSLSSLGLIEMSRKRTGISLKEFFYDECQICKATGYVKNFNMIFIELEENIYNLLFRKGEKRIKVKVHPEFHEFIFKNNLFNSLIQKGRIEIEATYQLNGYYSIEIV